MTARPIQAIAWFFIARNLGLIFTFVKIYSGNLDTMLIQAVFGTAVHIDN